MRRPFLSVLIGLVLILSSLLPATAAQDATPASPLGELGLPVLDITVSTSGYEGIPETLEAGRYLVTVTATEDVGEFGAGVGFIQPAGMTADEFLAALSGPPDEAAADAGAATPIEGAVASPAAADGGPPPFIFDSVFAGGIYALPGASAEIVLDLTPGEWIAWGDDPEATQAPVVIEVTGEMPAELMEPESSATITMGEYLIAVTEGELIAGPQVIRVDNVGAQPHFVIGARGPEGMTEEQVTVVLDEETQAEMTGTPPAYSDLNPDEDIEDAFFTGTQSAGTSIWIPATLEPGPHVLICFFPDRGDGMPHAYHGMYSVVEVAP